MPLWSMLSGLFLCLSTSVSAFSFLFWLGLHEHWQQDNKQLLSVTPSAVCSVQSVPPFSTRNTWAFSKTAQSSLSLFLPSHSTFLSLSSLLEHRNFHMNYLLAYSKKAVQNSLPPVSTLWPKLCAYCHSGQDCPKTFLFFSLCMHSLLTCSFLSLSTYSGMKSVKIHNETRQKLTISVSPFVVFIHAPVTLFPYLLTQSMQALTPRLCKNCSCF